MDREILGVVIWPIAITVAIIVCFIAWLRTKPSDKKNISIKYKSLSVALGHAVEETQKATGSNVADHIDRSAPSIGETANEQSIAALSRYVRDAWSALQADLNAVVVRAGPAPVTWQNHHKMLEYIFDKGLLPADLQMPIRDLLVIRNKLVHKGDDFLVVDIKNPNEFARSYVATARTLQEKIKGRILAA